MGQIERIYLLHQLFSTHRHGLAMERLAEELQTPVITIRRDLLFLRDTLGAPLVLEGDPSPKWRYVHGENDAPFQLPGVWLDADELFALLLALQLIEDRGGRGLSKLLGPLQQRLEKLLGHKVQRLGRLCVLRVQARRANQLVFRLVVQALLDARKIEFDYWARGSGKDQHWRVSPQRMLHHREHWYLDASDRKKGGKVFRFSIDRIRKLVVTEDETQDIPLDQLEDPKGPGYGIMAGPIVDEAVLVFSAEVAPWVGDEEWHPKQRKRELPGGRLELIVPYSRSRELLMDVMRYGPDAEVIGPPALREEMAELTARLAGVYRPVEEKSRHLERGGQSEDTGKAKKARTVRRKPRPEGPGSPDML